MLLFHKKIMPEPEEDQESTSDTDVNQTSSAHQPSDIMESETDSSEDKNKAFSPVESVEESDEQHPADDATKDQKV
jgi:hypothetical protein